MLADQVQAMADQMHAMAETIRRLEAEVEWHRERDRKLVTHLQTRQRFLDGEAARSSPCKAHYFGKRSVDLWYVEEVLTGSRAVEDVPYG